MNEASEHAVFMVPARITSAKVTPKVEDGDLVRTISFGVEVREDELRFGQFAAPSEVMAQLTDLSDAPVLVSILPRAAITTPKEPAPQTQLFEPPGGEEPAERAAPVPPDADASGAGDDRQDEADAEVT